MLHDAGASTRPGTPGSNSVGGMRCGPRTGASVSLRNFTLSPSRGQWRWCLRIRTAVLVSLASGFDLAAGDLLLVPALMRS